MSDIRKWKRGDITVRDGKVLRFIEEEVEGEKWEIIGALASPASDVVAEIVVEARRYAQFYPQGSDGRNTFEVFADKIFRRFGSKP